MVGKPYLQEVCLRLARRMLTPCKASGDILQGVGGTFTLEQTDLVWNVFGMKNNGVTICDYMF